MSGRLPLGTRWFAASMARRLPPRPFTARVERGLGIDAGDAVLRADHYRPDAEGPFPTVLLRSPYGRGFPWAPLLGATFASFGFHVVLVAVRGTAGSTGEFVPFRDEGGDDAATLAWLRGRDWFDGRLATLGPSYFGYVQLPFLADPPPELKAAVIQVAPHDPYRAFRPGGVLALESALVAATGMETTALGPRAFLAASLRLARRLDEVVRTVPLVDAYPRAVGGRPPWFDDWFAHPDGADPFWRALDHGAALDHCRVPVALIGGWHDILLDQTLEQYARLRAGGTEVELTVGPWTHTSAFDRGWPEVFGTSLAWLRRHLGVDGEDGADEAVEAAGRRAPVRVFTGGAGEWRELPDWPGTAPRRLFLAADGALAGDPPAAGGVSAFRYDPADPPPAIGGPSLGRRAGEQDDSALAARGDVLVLDGPPLTEDLEVLGPVRAELHLEAAVGDVFARLSDVGPDGRSVNVCEGVLALRPGDGVRAVTVPMSATAHRWKRGHRVRLVLAGGASPRYARPTGTAEPREKATEFVPFRVVVHHGAATPSALVLG